MSGEVNTSLSETQGSILQTKANENKKSEQGNRKNAIRKYTCFFNNNYNNNNNGGRKSIKNNNEKINSNDNKNSSSGEGSGSSGAGGSDSNVIKHSSLLRRHEDLRKQLAELEGQLAKVNLIDTIEKVKLHSQNINGLLKTADEDSTEADLQISVQKLKKFVTKLKFQVLSAQNISSDESHRYIGQNPSTIRYGLDAGKLFDLHTNKHFQTSPEFNDIQENYNSLDEPSRNCLFCFAAFTENEVVKKRLLIYWWMGEEFLVPEVEKAEEMIAEEIIQNLIDKGFIEPVNNKCSSFKMHPFIRSAVILLAQEKFFHFLSKESLAEENLSCQRMYLVKSGGGSSLQVPTSSPDSHQGKFQTLFNVSEAYLFFKPEWFLKMKNVQVLYLGRWQNSANLHIEVEDTGFLKGLKHMKNLKLLSLQGISRIMDLPDSICRATNLKILDLKACHNLEVLPEKIGRLKYLTHLDMSECFLLDHMPKGLASLFELQVLKGFVVGDTRNPCTLDDLALFKKLRKLSITTGLEAFPTDTELAALQKMQSLRKLTIAWGDKRHKPKKESSAVEQGKALMGRMGSKKKIMVSELTLPTELEKLDLQCFPRSTTPNWLMPGKLSKLKKLYIRGRELHGLGQAHDLNDPWTVKILRLKFLYNFKMNWTELQKLFPSLSYLEKVECPKLTFFPCDHNGVWMAEAVSIS